MPATLKRVEPLHAPITPPQGAVAAGVTPDGRQLYSMTRQRSRSVPRLDPVTKQEMWRKHQTTGEPMYQLRRPELYPEELLFTIESEGNGNNRMVPFQWPTEEEKAEQRRKDAIEQMQGGLAAALVDRGFTPEKLIAAIAALDRPTVPPEPVSGAVQTVATVSEVPAELEAPVLYPVKDENSNWWTLSNKQRVQGEKLARESELRIHEVKTEVVPEV